MKPKKSFFPRINLTPLAVKSITTAYFRNSYNRPEKQDEFLLKHIEKNMHSAFGEVYKFMYINSVKDFQQAVPIHHYDDLYLWIERCLRGEKDVLVKGKIDRFATSSGTTGQSKYIPVTNNSLKRNHYRAGTDLMMHYGKNNPNTKMWQGQGLVIGGGFSYNPYTGKPNVGYISAILQKNAPLVGKLMRQPNAQISYLSDRHKKVERMIHATTKKNITSISGQPSWCSAYLEKLVAHNHANNVLEIRKNFELVIRGGMAIDLYRDIFKRLLPSEDIKYYQVYNASEGFFAAQHENNRDDMLLFVDHDVFYEFIPFEDYLRKNYSSALLLSEVNVSKPYVIVITNSAGLWRYVLGDVIEFTGTSPYTIKITGRTKYHIDVAGECTPLQPLDEALRETAHHFNGTIKDYTIGPGATTSAQGGHYEVMIEWTKNPSCTEKEFAEHFDTLLCQKRTLYYDERHDTHMLTSPIVHFLPKDTFYHWLENRGKLGGQHKIPKVSNDRNIISTLLS